MNGNYRITSRVRSSRDGLFIRAFEMRRRRIRFFDYAVFFHYTNTNDRIERCIFPQRRARSARITPNNNNVIVKQRVMCCTKRTLKPLQNDTANCSSTRGSTSCGRVARVKIRVFIPRLNVTLSRGTRLDFTFFSDVLLYSNLTDTFRTRDRLRVSNFAR